MEVSANTAQPRAVVATKPRCADLRAAGFRASPAQVAPNGARHEPYAGRSPGSSVL